MSTKFEPIFVIGPGTFVDSIWFGPIPGGDVLAMLYRPEPGERVVLRMRFRYHRDDRVWDSDDEKSARSFAIDAPFAEARRRAQAIFEQTARTVGCDVPRRYGVGARGPDKVFAKIRDKPWFHQLAIMRREQN